MTEETAVFKKLKENSEWIDETEREKVHGFDERAVLRAYRFCKKHYEFFLGVGITVLVFLLILK